MGGGSIGPFNGAPSKDPCYMISELEKYIDEIEDDVKRANYLAMGKKLVLDVVLRKAKLGQLKYSDILDMKKEYEDKYEHDTKNNFKNAQEEHLGSLRVINWVLQNFYDY